MTRKRLLSAAAAAALVSFAVLGCGGEAPPENALAPGFCTTSVRDYAKAVAEDVTPERLANKAASALTLCSYESLDGSMDSVETFARLMAAADDDPRVRNEGLIEGARAISLSAADSARPKEVCLLVADHESAFEDGWPDLCDKVGVRKPNSGSPSAATTDGTTPEPAPDPEPAPEPRPAPEPDPQSGSPSTAEKVAALDGRTGDAAEYDRALRRLALRCDAPISEVADIVVRGQQVAEENGVSTTLMGLIEAAADSIPPEAVGVVSCNDVVAAWIVIEKG